MSTAPLTRPSLLIRIRDGNDHQAWQQFVELYSALIYGYARRRGLQDADAADLMQDVLRSVAVAASRLQYDPQKGTFRAWLATVTRNRIFNFLDGQRHRARGTGNSDMQQRLNNEPNRSPEADDQWELEWQRQLSARAMQQVEHEFQPATWKAFWMTAVEGKSAKEASDALGLSSGAIYVAKSRVLARLREEIESLSREELES
jgi:RNA polymerase sigma factor (sigma-70 family)